MKPPPFEYVAPGTLEEAVAALAEHGDEAKVLAGGQSLVPLLAFRLARPSILVDLNGVAELDYVRLDGDRLVLGALGRQRDVERLPGLRERCAVVVEAVENVGHVAIRNRGTVAGSLAHADPAAEWPALALVLDAELELAGPGGRRTVQARDFFVTYFTTALRPDEILAEVRVPLPNGRSGSCFLELARRHGDFAIAGVAAHVSLGDGGGVRDARIGLIGVADRPVRAEAAEAAIRGGLPGEERIAEAAAAVDEAVEPSGDIHATADYRRHAARVLTRRALALALARARGGDGRGREA